MYEISLIIGYNKFNNKSLDNIYINLINKFKDICYCIKEIKLNVFDLNNDIDIKLLINKLIKIKKENCNEIIVIEPYDKYLYKFFGIFGFKVYGVRYILNCLMNKKSLQVKFMKIKNIEIYENIKLEMGENLITENIISKYCCILENLKITTTGIDIILKKDIIEYIEILGGNYCENLTENTNYVICGNTLTEKSKIANQNNIPLIKIEWLILNLQNALKGHDKIDSYINFKCELLYGVKIYCINFCDYKHVSIENKIVINGGIFIKNENIQMVDLYIYLNSCECDNNKCSKKDDLLSEIIHNVKNIPIVNSSWLFSSIRANKIQDYDSHSVLNNYNKYDYLIYKNKIITSQNYLIKFNDIFDYMKTNSQYEIIIENEIVKNCPKIEKYIDFLKNFSKFNVTYINQINKSLNIKWVQFCFTNLLIIPIEYFMYETPLIFEKCLNLNNFQNLLKEKTIYISQNFKILHLFENIEEFKELLIYLGATIVENNADIVFDNSLKTSKSIYWLESMIYYNNNIKQLEYYNDDLNVLECGFLDNLLKDLFLNQTFYISLAIPYRIARHLILLINEYGGTLKWELELTDSINILHSELSLRWFFNCIKERRIISKCSSVLKPINLFFNFLNNDQNFKEDSFKIDRNFYFSTDLDYEEKAKLKLNIELNGGSLTDSLNSANYIVVKNLDSYFEKELLLNMDQLSHVKAIHINSILNFKPKNILMPNNILLNQTNNMNKIINTTLEDSIMKKVQIDTKLLQLEKNIESIMKIKVEKNKSQKENISTYSGLLGDTFNVDLNNYTTDFQNLHNMTNYDENDVIITYDNNSDDNFENNTCENIEYRFLLSTLPNNKKLILKDIIESLNGTYLNTSNFDYSSTHLIIGQQVAKNEKLLASLASGKIILHYSYLEASKEAGYFLNDVDYMNVTNCEYIDPIYVDAFSHWYSLLKVFICLKLF